MLRPFAFRAAFRLQPCMPIFSIKRILPTWIDTAPRPTWLFATSSSREGARKEPPSRSSARFEQRIRQGSTTTTTLSQPRTRRHCITTSYKVHAGTATLLLLAMAHEDRYRPLATKLPIRHGLLRVHDQPLSVASTCAATARTEVSVLSCIPPDAVVRLKRDSKN